MLILNLTHKLLLLLKQVMVIRKVQIQIVSAPASHSVTIREIIKEQGQSVTNADVNNAVQVENKRIASIKSGTALPSNLAGGSTTHIPVVITYNDGSTQEITETIQK